VQVLLSPIVSQLLVEPPAEVSLLKEGEAGDALIVQEMDDTLVSCLGQMALTAGSDLLWKPLNHEVIHLPFLVLLRVVYFPSKPRTVKKAD
jgi:U3 small nucleolar RNA-associated protein 10